MLREQYGLTSLKLWPLVLNCWNWKSLDKLISNRPLNILYTSIRSEFRRLRSTEWSPSDWAFLIAAAKTWNSLPLEVTSSRSISALTPSLPLWRAVLVTENPSLRRLSDERCSSYIPLTQCKTGRYRLYSYLAYMGTVGTFAVLGLLLVEFLVVDRCLPDNCAQGGVVMGSCAVCKQ